jgi:hypothetical protein
MIQKVYFISEDKKIEISYKIENRELVLNFPDSFTKTAYGFFEIHLNTKISKIWNHDSKWIAVPKSFTASFYNSKVISLDSQVLVQANCCHGIWEISAKNPKILQWHFNAKNSFPITTYVGNNNQRIIKDAKSAHFPDKISLLFPKKNAIEISKSEIPFSAVACFTDHCDFDTLINLQTQRNFFKSINLKITKGFFLNHFSKRSDNASFEKHAEELLLWQQDGHELAYHSLSQSIKNEQESKKDFENFVPPFEIPVWIDHGYQPYNFSLYRNGFCSDSQFESNLIAKKIQFLWNYIDSATSTNGVINQLNTNQLSIKAYAKGISNTGFFIYFQALLKAIVFHLSPSDRLIFTYKQSATGFKKIFFQRQFKLVPQFIRDLSGLFWAVFKVFLGWNFFKNKSYPLAKYTPVFFKHTIKDQDFIVFQTLEMINFETSLSKKNIDLLVQEHGVFIAHTYFSDSIVYHEGKFLIHENEINPIVKANFEYLSDKIKLSKIWNPTISEWYDYLQHFDSVYFSLNAAGNVQIHNANNLHYRNVN